MPLDFVNYRGEAVSTIAPPQQKKRPKAADESFHKGWRVTGVPPGALEEARAAHLKKSRLELQNGKQPKEFIDAEWLRNARQKPVRAKPYAVADAAEVCAELARKGGWLQVTVTPIEKIVSKTESQTLFKHLIIYRIASSWQADLAAVEEALARIPFTPCGPTQERSAGWVPPRGEEEGLFAESIGGQWILRFMSEAKMLPASVLNRKVQEKADAIEQSQGRKPGKKEKQELKDEAKLDLLPMAFTKQGGMWIWIDPEARFLVLDTGSQSRADEVVTLLVDGLPGFAVALLDTQASPQAAMAHWLTSQEPPAAFTIDRECELKSADEAKSVVRYGRHPLDIDEVKAHIEGGKLPTKLALTWDDRVSLLLTENLQIKKLTFLESVFDGRADDDGGFDADVVIATGELSMLLPDLIKALGGEGRTALGEGLPAALQQPKERP